MNNTLNYRLRTKPINRTFNFIKGNSTPIQSNSQFQFARQHALNIYKKNAIYTFIPKNGCTSLRASLAVENGFLTKQQISTQINWVHNNSYSFNATIKELILSDYSFTILRCPYDRLASLFLDKFVDKSPIAWIFYRLSNNQFLPDELTFEDFINYLNQNPSILNGDIHWRRQTDFLIYEKYDDYFDFSNFNNISKVLGKKIGLDIIDTRKITNHGRENYKKVENNVFSNTPVKTLHEQKGTGFIPTTESLYTSSLKEKVKNIYKQDFDAINNLL